MERESWTFFLGLGACWKPEGLYGNEWCDPCDYDVEHSWRFGRLLKAHAFRKRQDLGWLEWIDRVFVYPPPLGFVSGIMKHHESVPATWLKHFCYFMRGLCLEPSERTSALGERPSTP